jgi:hypothetical protein
MDEEQIAIEKTELKMWLKEAEDGLNHDQTIVGRAIYEVASACQDRPEIFESNSQARRLERERDEARTRAELLRDAYEPDEKLPWEISNPTHLFF